MLSEPASPHHVAVGNSHSSTSRYEPARVAGFSLRELTKPCQLGQPPVLQKSPLTWAGCAPSLRVSKFSYAANVGIRSSNTIIHIY